MVYYPPLSFPSSHSVSWAEWYPEREGHYGRGKQDFNKAFYDVELIMRSNAHNLESKQLDRIQQYIEVARKGLDVQQWLDEKEENGNASPDFHPHSAPDKEAEMHRTNQAIQPDVDPEVVREKQDNPPQILPDEAAGQLIQEPCRHIASREKTSEGKLDQRMPGEFPSDFGEDSDCTNEELDPQANTKLPGSPPSPESPLIGVPVHCLLEKSDQTNPNIPSHDSLDQTARTNSLVPETRPHNNIENNPAANPSNESSRSIAVRALDELPQEATASNVEKKQELYSENGSKSHGTYSHKLLLRIRTRVVTRHKFSLLPSNTYTRDFYFSSENISE